MGSQVGGRWAPAIPHTGKPPASHQHGGGPEPFSHSSHSLRGCSEVPTHCWTPPPRLHIQGCYPTHQPQHADAPQSQVEVPRSPTCFLLGTPKELSVCSLLPPGPTWFPGVVHSPSGHSDLPPPCPLPATKQGCETARDRSPTPHCSPLPGGTRTGPPTSPLHTPTLQHHSLGSAAAALSLVALHSNLTAPQSDPTPLRLGFATPASRLCCPSTPSS